MHERENEQTHLVVHKLRKRKMCQIHPLVSFFFWESFCSLIGLSCKLDMPMVIEVF